MHYIIKDDIYNIGHTQTKDELRTSFIWKQAQPESKLGYIGKNLSFWVYFYLWRRQFLGNFQPTNAQNREGIFLSIFISNITLDVKKYFPLLLQVKKIIEEIVPLTLPFQSTMCYVGVGGVKNIHNISRNRGG